MEQLVSAIERMSDAVERTGEVAVAAAQRLGVEVEEVNDKLEDASVEIGAFEEAWFKAGEAAQKSAKDTLREWANVYKRLDKRLDEHHRKWTAMGREMGRQTMHARGALGTAGGQMGLGLSGPRGVMGAFRGLQSKILMSLPMGGLLGLMLYGVAREEGFRAQTAEIMRTMDQLGGSTRGQVREVRSDVETMFRALGGDRGMQGLVATMQAFSEFSIGEERFEKLEESSGKAVVSIRQLATGIDMFNKAQPGTTAKLMGQAMESAGRPLREISDEMRMLNELARSSNVSFIQLASTMSQSLSGLRMQRQGVSDLAESYLGLAEGLERNAGMSRGQARVSAMRGVSALAGSLGSMNEGLMGYVAQRVQGRTGQGTGDPFEAMMRLRLGDVTGSDYMGQVVEELQTIAREQFGGSRYRQIGGLAKLGFPDEAARAIVDMGSSGASIKALEDAMKDPSTVMKEAITKEISETNRIAKAMEKAMYDLSKIGAGMLTVILTGFRGTWEILKNFGDSAKREEAANIASRGMATGWSKVGGGLARMKGLGGELGEIVQGYSAMDAAFKNLDKRSSATAADALKNISTVTSVPGAAYALGKSAVGTVSGFFEPQKAPTQWGAPEQRAYEKGGAAGLKALRRKQQAGVVNEAPDDIEVVVRKKQKSAKGAVPQPGGGY
jgi:hypothetical protein